MTDSSGMSVSIRRCEQSEVDTLRQVALETYDHAFRSMNSKETMDRYLETAFARNKLLEELSNPRCTFFLMHLGGRLCGYLKVNEAPAQSDINDPESLEIERIYIKKEFQGKGLGRTLINYSMQVAGDRGKKYLWLGVWEKNENAVSFYQEMGFAITGTHGFQMGDELQRDLVMKKQLVERE